MPNQYTKKHAPVKAAAPVKRGKAASIAFAPDVFKAPARKRAPAKKVLGDKQSSPRGPVIDALMGVLLSRLSERGDVRVLRVDECGRDQPDMVGFLPGMPTKQALVGPGNAENHPSQALKMKAEESAAREIPRLCDELNNATGSLRACIEELAKRLEPALSAHGPEGETGLGTVICTSIGSSLNAAISRTVQTEAFVRDLISRLEL